MQLIFLKTHYRDFYNEKYFYTYFNYGNINKLLSSLDDPTF